MAGGMAISLAAIVREVIDGYGGCSSHLGLGTTFRRSDRIDKSRGCNGDR
jgi:hypothetical protein